MRECVFCFTVWMSLGYMCLCWGREVSIFFLRLEWKAWTKIKERLFCWERWRRNYDFVMCHVFIANMFVCICSAFCYCHCVWIGTKYFIGDFALCFFVFRFVTLTLHYVTFLCVISCFVALHFVLLCYFLLRYISSHFVTLCFVSLHFVSLRYLMFCCITFRYLIRRNF